MFIREGKLQISIIKQNFNETVILIGHFFLSSSESAEKFLMDPAKKILTIIPSYEIFVI